MAKRLRDILVARGWEVKMTRDTDVDVYAPNDSAHDELQARVDIANKAGARLFVSIHANAFINSGPYGTTCYISKPDDVAFARIVERHLAADGTKDDGIVKSHLYVTLHTRMPAVLIETAFLSNPSDYALLTSPAWRQKVAQEIADGIGAIHARVSRFPINRRNSCDDRALRFGPRRPDRARARPRALAVASTSIFFADQAHVPYGDRTHAELLAAAARESRAASTSTASTRSSWPATRHARSPSATAGRLARAGARSD